MKNKKPLNFEDFGTRIKKERYQVRFWSSKEAYGKFKAECERRDLKMQDVFNQFMIWFYKDEK